MTMTTATVAPAVLNGSTKVDWADTGTKILPKRHRDAFLRCLNGEPITEWDEDNRPTKWVPPVGNLPFSPGMSIKTVLGALGIRSPLAFSHSQAWEYDERNGTPRPGSMDAYVATATVLGIRTAKQELWFLDAGDDVTPVLFVTRPTVAHWHFTPGADGIVSTSAFATPERAEFATDLVNRGRDDDKKVEPIRCACTEGEEFRARSDAFAAAGA